jgi:hypothetical protein
MEKIAGNLLVFIFGFAFCSGIFRKNTFYNLCHQLLLFAIDLCLLTTGSSIQRADGFRTRPYMRTQLPIEFIKMISISKPFKLSHIPAKLP